jgi:mono/diheme cytochrome c family protein
MGDDRDLSFSLSRLERGIEMRKIRIPLFIASILTTTLVLGQNAVEARPANAKKAPQSANLPDPGQRKFEANCSRCHSAPEQLRPSLTGTVVRHMRVRANLSAQDEKDILKYLAP